MAIKVNGTTVIDDSRNATFTGASISGTTNFSNANSLSVPSGTTLERPASPSSGYLRYNTDTSEFELFNGSEWTGVGSGGELEKASLTKSFVANEQATVNLSSSISNPFVSVIKEVPQIGVTNNDWDVSADGSNFTLHDTAYDTTLTPSSATDSGTFTLGSGSFAAEDVGKRIIGNGGEADLLNSDGSYDIILPFNNTTTISSGNWSMFALDANSGVLSLSTYILNNNEYNLANNQFIFEFGLSDAIAIAIKPDGTKLYSSIYRSNAVREYSLSDPFNIASASFSQEISIDPSDQFTDNRGAEAIFFRPDGLKMYLRNEGITSITEYDLSTAWDISTVSYSGRTLSYNEKAFFFKPDGTRLFTADDVSDTIVQYNLSTPWNLSSASSSGITFSVINSNNVEDLHITDDGQYMYVLNRGADRLDEYVLSSAWDITSATLTGESVTFAETGDPTRLSMAEGRVYIASYANNQVLQYTAFDTAIPSNQYSTAITSTPIDTELWTDINSMVVDESLIFGNIYYSLSNDDRTTWKILDNINGERSIVRNNSGVWEINNASDYNTETWISAATNDEFYALEEAVDINTAQTNSIYDIKNASYSNKSYDVSTESTAPGGLFFKPDGTRMYIVGYGAPESVYEYNLSIAWDVSSASYSGRSVDISTEDGNPREVFFKPDGTKMFVSGLDSDSILEYSLTTAWNVSTASYTGNSFVTVDEVAPRGFYIRDDGLRMFVIGTGTDSVLQFDLETAWDITTAVYTSDVDISSNRFDVSDEGTAPSSISFRSDGFTMYVLDYGQDSIQEYFLRTAWDISTAFYSGNSFSVKEQEATPNSLFFKPDGTIVYVAGSSSDSVYQYNTTSTTSANRMSGAKLKGISDAGHLALNNNLDLSITLYIGDNGISSSSNGVTINYDANILNSLAVLGADYEYDQPNDSTVRIKSINSENLRIRVI